MREGQLQRCIGKNLRWFNLRAVHKPLNREEASFNGEQALVVGRAAFARELRPRALPDLEKSGSPLTDSVCQETRHSPSLEASV